MLTDDQKRLYARHILLEQLGASGQARLCAAHVKLGPEADARAAAVALDYLARAGVRASESASDESLELGVGSTAAIEQLAGDPALHECAAWLNGAYAAVEAIKRIAGVGSPGRLDADLSLISEVI